MKNFMNKAVGDEPHDRRLQAPLVVDYMVKDVITFKKDTEMVEVIETLLNNRITGAPVLNDKGEVIGIIDDKDCLRLLFGSAYYNQPSGKETVGNYMSTIMKSISSTADVVEAANIFMQTTYKRLIVKDDEGKMVGQISRRDVLRAVKDMKSNTW